MDNLLCPKPCQQYMFLLVCVCVTLCVCWFLCVYCVWCAVAFGLKWQTPLTTKLKISDAYQNQLCSFQISSM